MKKDKRISVVAMVMTGGGIPITLIWICMLGFGGLVKGGVPPYFNAFSIAGAAGAFIAIINGVLINKNKAATGKARIAFAVLTAALSLPGSVMFLFMTWYFAALPAFLFGFGPSAYYLLRVYDEHSDRKI